jgi:hypothetical protein
VDYNEMSVHYWKLKDGSDEYEDLIKIIFRAYNDGIAYRYEIATKAGETITIKNENVEFVFPDDYRFGGGDELEWMRQRGIRSSALVNAQRMQRKTLSNMEKGTKGILNIEVLPDVLHIGLGEIPRAGFAPLRFQSGRERTGTFNNLYDGFGRINRTGKLTAIALLLDGDTEIPGTGDLYRTPWRVITGPPADNEGGNSDLFRSLQTPDQRGAGNHS